MPKKAALLLMVLASLAPDTVSASVVSRLGAIYFYDPLSFDAGVLQRGGSVKQGYSSSGYLLDAAMDLPLFHEFALRLGYQLRLDPEAAAGHDLSWRVRMPVLETARYGRLSSVQIVYAGHHPFARMDPVSPRHEFSGAWSGSLARTGPGWTIHTQFGFVYRAAAQVEHPLKLGRLGLVGRVGFVLQIYRPPFGRGGMWTTTISVAEATLIHFGASGSYGGEGRMTLAGAAPSIHFSPGSSTYTLGLAPIATWSYGPAGSRIDWGGQLVLAGFFRTHTE